jgi:hypothetical protein
MRPSVEKSLLLALGLAIGASSLDGVRGRGPMAHPAEERLRAAAAAVSLGATAAAGPRLVLLPPVARAVPAASPGDAAAPSPEARRDEFLRRARRLVDAGAAAGPPVR